MYNSSQGITGNYAGIKSIMIVLIAGVITTCVLLWCRSCHLAELLCVLITVHLVHFINLNSVFVRLVI